MPAPAATRDTVETVRALLEDGHEHTSVKRIADRLEVGRSATYDRMRRALTAGFLVNVAKENEPGLKIALGAELPRRRQVPARPGRSCPVASGCGTWTTFRLNHARSRRLVRSSGSSRYPRDGRRLTVSVRPTAAERVENPDALLSRTDLRELGLERRAVDSIFRQLPSSCFEGYSRPLVRVADYLELVARSTYRGDRVRP